MKINIFFWKRGVYELLEILPVCSVYMENIGVFEAMKFPGNEVSVQLVLIYKKFCTVSIIHTNEIILVHGRNLET